MLGIIEAAIRGHDAPDLPPPPTGPPPPERDRRRGLIKLDTPDVDDRPELSIDDARALIRAEMDAYLAMDHPSHMLLIALPPGAGKTTEAVRQAERFAAEQRGRVLYAGPRHELWEDLMRESTVPREARAAWWYHWQPHTAGDPETGQGQTCRWARQFREWSERGHKGFYFCQKPRVCGFHYINTQCVYHAQKARQQPIVFVQHLDIVLGHPFLEHASLVIGDESPLAAFLHDWRIPPHAIIPASAYADEAGRGSPELTLDAGVLELLLQLRNAVDRPARDLDGTPLAYWHGPALLRQLGGAMTVYRTCRDAVLDPAYGQVPTLPGGTPDGVDHVPYAHLLPLLALLRDEAEEAIHGRDYISRVRVDRGGLRLLLRRAQPLLCEARHVIWLDATANPDLYRAMFDREVRVVAPRVRMAGSVHQVYASLNNRDTLIGDDVPSDPKAGKRGKHRSAKRQTIVEQVQQIVARGGYTRPAIVTYKDLKDSFGYDAAHFYGLRGSNAFTAHDALIVIGTPQPSLDGLADQGAMLHQERRRPFAREWTEQIRPYGATGWGYAVSGFWQDGDLHALLMQAREAELVQAAHRVRPLFRPVPIWLLTNLPLPDLPPHAVLSLNDLFDAPPGVDTTRWPEVDALANRLGALYPEDLEHALHIPRRTAQRWIAAARQHPSWQPVERMQGRVRVLGVQKCKAFFEAGMS